MIAAHFFSTWRTVSLNFGVERFLQVGGSLVLGAIKFQVFPGEVAVFPTGFFSMSVPQGFELLQFDFGTNYDMGSPVYFVQIPIWIFGIVFGIGVLFSWGQQSLVTRGEQAGAPKP